MADQRRLSDDEIRKVQGAGNYAEDSLVALISSGVFDTLCDEAILRGQELEAYQNSAEYWKRNAEAMQELLADTRFYMFQNLWWHNTSPILRERVNRMLGERDGTGRHYGTPLHEPREPHDPVPVGFAPVVDVVIDLRGGVRVRRTDTGGVIVYVNADAKTPESEWLPYAYYNAESPITRVVLGLARLKDALGAACSEALAEADRFADRLREAGAIADVELVPVGIGAGAWYAYRTAAREVIRLHAQHPDSAAYHDALKVLGDATEAFFRATGVI